jgi:transposase
LDIRIDGVANQMTPENHLVRKLDKVLDFSFINNDYDLSSCSADTENITPEFILRYMLLIHLFYLDCPVKANNTVEEHIDDQIQGNAVYRWFLKSEFGEYMSSHEEVSCAMRNYCNKEKWNSIFEQILKQCADNGLPYKQNGAWEI